MGPVAGPTHVDVVPRRAVRKVGPRSDLTRSTHIGEPCGQARSLGDGSRSFCSPYRAAHQPTGGDRTKNGGSNPPAPGSRCVEPPGGLSRRPGGFVFSANRGADPSRRRRFPSPPPPHAASPAPHPHSRGPLPPVRHPAPPLLQHAVRHHTQTPEN